MDPHMRRYDSLLALNVESYVAALEAKGDDLTLADLRSGACVCVYWYVCVHVRVHVCVCMRETAKSVLVCVCVCMCVCVCAHVCL
jgi:hypothetical protein